MLSFVIFSLIFCKQLQNDKLFNNSCRIWTRLLWNQKRPHSALKWQSLVSFSFIFAFSNKHYNFYNKYMWIKCPSSIWCWDLNPRPSEHESPPITTRPGLTPIENGKIKSNSKLTFIRRLLQTIEGDKKSSQASDRLNVMPNYFSKQQKLSLRPP